MREAGAATAREYAVTVTLVVRAGSAGEALSALRELMDELEAWSLPDDPVFRGYRDAGPAREEGSRESFAELGRVARGEADGTRLRGMLHGTLATVIGTNSHRGRRNYGTLRVVLADDRLVDAALPPGSPSYANGERVLVEYQASASAGGWVVLCRDGDGRG